MTFQLVPSLPALIEKSIKYIANTASQIVSKSFWYIVSQVSGQNNIRRTESLSDPVNIDANHLVKPSSIIAKAQMRVPIIIYGLRLPNLDVQLSARIPNGHFFKRYVYERFVRHTHLLEVAPTIQKRVRRRTRQPFLILRGPKKEDTVKLALSFSNNSS